MKRFKVTATGKVKRGHACKRHLLTKKNAGRKRGLRHSTLVSDAETPSVRKMLLA
jgi:large subunit ribosomal protein L35